MKQNLMKVVMKMMVQMMKMIRVRIVARTMGKIMVIKNMSAQSPCV